jgi:hypothetical protein
MLAKSFLKLLLEAVTISVTSTTTSTSIKRMKTSTLLSYATALVSDPTESRLSTFVFDDEIHHPPSPSTPSSNINYLSSSMRPSFNQSSSFVSSSSAKPRAFSTSTTSPSFRASNLNDPSIPYIFGSDILYKASNNTYNGGPNLKKNEISKLCSRIDVVLKYRATNANNSKNTSSSNSSNQHQKTLFEELICAEQIKGMASYGRVCLEDGDLLSALLYSLDALEQYNSVISASMNNNNNSTTTTNNNTDDNNDQQFDSRISVLCLSTIALSAVVVLGTTNGPKISERCCGRAVAIAMIAATTSPTSLADALLAKCYCSITLGNLASAADDSARAADILKGAKFIDPRRALCVATARSQVLIISGALSAAGDVTKDTMSESRQGSTPSINGGHQRHHHASVARLRPSIQKVTLSRFFLVQHGGDEPNGLTNNDFLTSLTNGFRLLDIDVDDAFHVSSQDF